jgi:hypothetical protein
VRIGSDQRKFFFDTLRDQNAIEGVAVVKFQALDPQHVLQRDWQDLNPVRSQDVAGQACRSVPWLGFPIRWRH